MPPGANWQRLFFGGGGVDIPFGRAYNSHPFPGWRDAALPLVDISEIIRRRDRASRRQSYQ